MDSDRQKSPSARPCYFSPRYFIPRFQNVQLRPSWEFAESPAIECPVDKVVTLRLSKRASQAERRYVGVLRFRAE